jgi:plastocyanin
VTRALLVIGGALMLAASVSAAPGGPGRVREVSMPGKVFAPGRIQVLVGDTVVWRNADGINHTVTSDDDLFDSDFVGPGLTFARAFGKTGHFKYHCSIHKFMRGEVDVVPVALSVPAGAVVSGGRVVLHGLAPTGTPRVTVERATGRKNVVARAVPAADGSFTVALRAFGPEDFVALARGVASPHVHVPVAPKVLARLGGGALRASATPARDGARAALQRYDREHFAWRTVARGRLDAASRASFPRPARPGRYRVVVRGAAGWADGASGAVVVASAAAIRASSS